MIKSYENDSSIDSLILFLISLILNSFSHFIEDDSAENDGQNENKVLIHFLIYQFRLWILTATYMLD